MMCSICSSSSSMDCILTPERAQSYTDGPRQPQVPHAQTLGHGERTAEALLPRLAFETLSEYDQGSVIEFLETLQVLPPGTTFLVVDEHGEKKRWTPQHHIE